MKDITDKIDNNGTADGRLPAAEYNDHKNELQNVVENSGQTLTPTAGTDVIQLAKAIAAYAAIANNYLDTGIADALVADSVGSFEHPDENLLQENMRISILPAANGTGGAATLDFFGEVRAIKTINDSNPDSEDIKQTVPLDLQYFPSFDGGSGAWVMIGSFGEALLRDNNLSDLKNVNQARNNLGLGALATLDEVDSGQITNEAVRENKIQDPTVNGGYGLGNILKRLTGVASTFVTNNTAFPSTTETFFTGGADPNNNRRIGFSVFVSGNISVEFELESSGAGDAFAKVMVNGTQQGSVASQVGAGTNQVRRTFPVSVGDCVEIHHRTSDAFTTSTIKSGRVRSGTDTIAVA